LSNWKLKYNYILFTSVFCTWFHWNYFFHHHLTQRFQTCSGVTQSILGQIRFNIIVYRIRMRWSASRTSLESANRSPVASVLFETILIKNIDFLLHSFYFWWISHYFIFQIKCSFYRWINKINDNNKSLVLGTFEEALIHSN